MDDLYVKIRNWPGTKKITGMSAFPLDYHPCLEQIRSALMRRGKAFEALCGYHYKYYKGIGVGLGPWGPVKYQVDSRIIIDCYAWNRFNPNDQVSLYELSKEVTPADWDDVHSSDVASIESEDDGEDDESSVDDNAADGEESEPIRAALTEQQLMLCGSTLRGYSLKNKKWLKFDIDHVTDINYSDTAFQSLVLPGEHKELILALAESQKLNNDNFDDVVQGKGKGMIMLLSGPPGVGKTLTAEAVAEVMRSPLYMLSAGDLGTEASEVETSLSNVMEMASKWNAILLIDEADVFLEERSTADLERNKLVSIFLRILEYYEGTLFLTTNRVEHIDPAFQSRIHVSMRYQELSIASRRQVWKTFVESSAASKSGELKGKHAFTDDDLDRLAKYRMNGREIKNVLKTAQLLASKQQAPLGANHVDSILAIEQRHIR